MCDVPEETTCNCPLCGAPSIVYLEDGLAYYAFDPTQYETMRSSGFIDWLIEEQGAEVPNVCNAGGSCE